MDELRSRIRIEHIRSAINLIKSFIADKTMDEFKADIVLLNAVLYQFIIIGEAVNHIDSRILEKYHYPWHIPRSFRNYIAHEYHKIRPESVYNAATDIDGLLNIVELILSKEF